MAEGERGHLSIVIADICRWQQAAFDSKSNITRRHLSRKYMNFSGSEILNSLDPSQSDHEFCSFRSA